MYVNEQKKAQEGNTPKIAVITAEMGPESGAIDKEDCLYQYWVCFFFPVRVYLCIVWVVEIKLKR